MVDLETCIDGDPKARLVQFRAFFILRLAQAAIDCPWYHPISKIILWRELKLEILSFVEWEKKLSESQENP